MSRTDPPPDLRSGGTDEAIQQAGDAEPFAGVGEWLTFPQVARRLAVSASKVRQLVHEHQLAAVRESQLAEPAVPADFVQDGAIVRGLSGTLMLLADSGFDDAAAINWLYATDDTLPGRPIDALRANRGKEVRRRAQAMG